MQFEISLLVGAPGKLITWRAAQGSILGDAFEASSDTRRGGRNARRWTYDATSAGIRVIIVLVKPDQIADPIGV